MYFVCTEMVSRPVGCRIRQRHLCRGVWPDEWGHLFAVGGDRKALGRIPGRWAVIDPVTEWSMTLNTSFWPLLGLTGGRIWSDPINRLVMSSPSNYIFYPDRTFKSALAASSQPLSVSQVGWGCRTHRLLLCRGVRTPPQQVSWIWHETIWWWRSSNAGALGNAEYPFVAIAPRSTLARRGSTW